MKRVIGGLLYDTETAEEIAFGSHRHELSDAWWRLYRTPTGVYFEVAAGHDGVVESFTPMTDQQARKFLETNANTLVERYFGPMPQPTHSLFSRLTVITAIDVLEIHLSQAEISSLFTDLGPEVYEELPDTGSAKSRMVELKRFVDRNPSKQVDEGLLENVIVERAARFMPLSESDEVWLSEGPATFARFQRALSQNGYVVSEGMLRRELPEDIGLPTAEAELIRLLDRHELETAKGHLDQALKNHARGDWASANSQIRSFLEGLFDELAVKLGSDKVSGHPRRADLAKLTPALFDRELGEWSDNGAGFVNGLMKRLHPHGSHPGLSDEEDCTFRLHIVLLSARFFLHRFDKTRN